MRIGLITGEYPPMRGGVADYTHRLACEWVAQGDEVFVFSNPQANTQSPGIYLTTHDGWGLGSLWAVRQWAQHNALDVVNMQFQTAAYEMSPVVHFLPHVLNTPFVTTFHDLRFPYLFPKAGALRDWIVMHLARASDGVIATNPADYARVRHLPHAAEIPIMSNVPVELPADYDRAVYRQQVGADDDTFLIAFFGFLNHSKGLDTLLYALREARDNDVPANVVFIGDRTGTADPTNAAYAQQIDALIRELHLSDHVRETGFVSASDVSAYFTASDVAALPFRDGASYRRGTLMAAIEHGCAIITTYPEADTPGIDAAHFQLIPPEHSSALAEAIQTLYTSPLRRETLQEQTRQLRSRFDVTTIANDIRLFFQQVIDTTRS
jgi:glycosyltransferase involved in cell wall biosynthesis